MFLERSRYAKTATVKVKDARGKEDTALKRRVLPTTQGSPAKVKNHDRLDLIAHERFGEATRFWHLADANTALDSTRLIATPAETINIPNS